MKLTEYDATTHALFNPEDIVKRIKGFPTTVITCFAHDLLEYAELLYKGEIVGGIRDANGERFVYQIEVEGTALGLTISPVCAPAAVGTYEDLFAMGAQKILVFGTCGVLDREIEDCGIIIPDCGVRDEGTSFHYVKASDEIAVNVHSLEVMKTFFKQQQINYTVGKVWTTDAIYRETVSKIERRKKEGCICVDMECTAIAALAEFREKTIAQFFYAADNLDTEVWDKRSLDNHANIEVKKKIVELAARLALHI